MDAWIREALISLNLPQWEVTVIRDAADVEAWADIAAHSQADTADLRLSHDFWKQESSKQREILTHELIHLATCRADQVVESLEETIGKIGWAILEPQYENAAERAVEHIAKLLAPSLPMPDFPTQ
jgi:hypothetical protein